MTEARHDSCNCGTMGILSFIGFVMTCDTGVTCYCIKPLRLCIYIEERLKHLNVK
jgi:hypothetical protein